MSERERPDLDAVAKSFEENEKKVMSDEGRSMRHSEDRRKDDRRKGTLRRAGEKTAASLAVGGALFGAGELALHAMDGKPLGRTPRAPEAKIKEQEAQHRKAEQAKVHDAIAKAKADAEAGTPVASSGVIDVSEDGVNGYVDLNSPNPEDTTRVTMQPETGGLPAESQSETGGLPAESDDSTA
ncbi:MAG: hypothetical protein Q8Q11_01080 [bacterium]|nr:hypothetical protein [bacterium]MDZ4247918.1 hypothetical protein [Patescibacteria group bacterium]